MKQCGKCKVEKELSEFSVDKRRNKLQGYCKGCNRAYNREHYKKNKKEYSEKNSIIRKRSRKTAREFVYEFLLENECLDCGESDPVVLEFDHREQKEYNICRMVANGTSIDKIKNEISKCEVRCANCHKKRHAKENKSFRYLMGCSSSRSGR